MNENNENFTPAAPNFKTLVRMCFQGLTNFPYIEEDFDALTNYELLSKVVEYLNQVISNNNEQNTLMTGLYNAYVSLQNYVNNYFDNLDVQDEINNKLDAMVEDGTLQEIIADYLSLKAVFGFDNVASMKTSTYLKTGMIVKTSGYYSVNDGGGAFYIISENLTPDLITLELNNGLYAKLLTNDKIINSKKIGLKGDKTSDETNLLQTAIDYCKDNNFQLCIDGFVYVTDTIDTKGISIIGVGKLSNGDNTYTSSKYGYIGWDYFRNVNNGSLITFEDYCNDYLTSGSGIISDLANPILQVNYSDGRFDLENIAVCGWLRLENQEGLLSIYDENSVNYLHGKHKFNNVNVFNCGGNGIHLRSLELVTVNKLSSSYNFGYGLMIEGISNHDAPFEYVKFVDCKFNSNKKDGFYAKRSFKKDVEFDNCQSNASGLYSELGLNIPDNTKSTYAGFRIEGGNLYNNSSVPMFNLCFNKCYGEGGQVLININTNDFANSSHVINNVDIHNCVFYPSTASDLSCLVYYDNSYNEKFSCYNNYYNGSNYYIFSTATTHITPVIVDNNFYDNFDNLASNISFSSKITVNQRRIKRFGNIVKLQILATANEELPGYENLATNLPKPIDNYVFIGKIGSDYKQGTIWQNNKLNFSDAIASGSSIFIDIVYFTSLTTGRVS